MDTQIKNGEFSDNEDWQTATVSIVGSATETDTSPITVAAVLDGIRDGRWKNPVGRVKAEYEKAYNTAVENGNPNPTKAARKAVDLLKKKLPAIAFSGQFSKRCDEGILTHSGFLCVDIDVCDVATMRDKLKSDPYVAAVFVSPTGSGLKALVRTLADVALHERSFLAAKRYFKEAHSLEIDNCKDLSRLCFVSYDPKIFIRNGDAEILDPEPESVPRQRDEKTKAAPEPDGDYASLPRPCYRVYHAPWHDGAKWRGPGTWFHNRRVIEPDRTVDIDIRLCAPLEVLAKTSVRGDIEHGRLVEFTSSNGIKKRYVLPMRFFAGRGDEALGVLLSLGLETNRDNQKEILRYIQEETPNQFYKMALATGWFDSDTFVMPDGPIGLERSREKVVYQGLDTENPYAAGGTLEDWKTKVAALASGNPNLIVTICAGLAGPLLYPLNFHGAILHLFGATSTGKTSALEAGASVWGGGEADNKNKFTRNWMATKVGLEAAAALHCDTVMILDEIHNVDPHTLNEMIYTLVNGCGKSRGNVNASVRPTPRWRVLLLSSGEMSSETKLYSGGFIIRGGQAVRMPDIPVEGVHGAFDNLHDFEHGGAFADQLRWNARHFYGQAGPAFVKKLIEENPDLHDLLGEALKMFRPQNDLQRRLARTFAALAIAGELAALWGIVPWKEEEAIQSCALLFSRWQKQMRASATDSPDSKIREVVASYIDKYSDSRFSSIEDHQAKVMERSGYWKDEAVIGDDSQTRRIYMFTPSGLKEATRTYDIRHVIAALDAAGALVRKDPEGKTSVTTTTPRRSKGERLYHIDPEKLI